MLNSNINALRTLILRQLLDNSGRWSSELLVTDTYIKAQLHKMGGGPTEIIATEIIVKFGLKSRRLDTTPPILTQYTVYNMRIYICPIAKSVSKIKINK